MTIPDARAAVGKLLGIDGFDGSAEAYSNLSQEDQVRVSDRLKAYIVANAGAFTADQVDTSKQNMASSAYGTGLADTSFDVGMFGDELLKNAAKVTAAGGSVLTKAIYIAVALGVVAYVLPAALAKAKLKKAAAAV
jgi:hypothetical protein